MNPVFSKLLQDTRRIVFKLNVNWMRERGACFAMLFLRAYHFTLLNSFPFLNNIQRMRLSINVMKRLNLFILNDIVNAILLFWSFASLQEQKLGSNSRIAINRYLLRILLKSGACRRAELKLKITLILWNSKSIQHFFIVYSAN